MTRIAASTGHPVATRIAQQVGHARAENVSLFRISPFSNRLLFVTAAASILLLWAVTHGPVSAGVLGVVPLSIAEWLTTGLIAASVLVIVEADKLIRRLRARRAHA